MVLSSTSADHGVFDSAGGGGSPHDDAIITLNDEGTAFTAAIELHAKDDLRPGFYTITGRIVQVANLTDIIDS